MAENIPNPGQRLQAFKIVQRLNNEPTAPLSEHIGPSIANSLPNFSYEQVQKIRTWYEKIEEDLNKKREQYKAQGKKGIPVAITQTKVPTRITPIVKSEKSPVVGFVDVDKTEPLGFGWAELMDIGNHRVRVRGGLAIELFAKYVPKTQYTELRTGKSRHTLMTTAFSAQLKEDGKVDTTVLPKDSRVAMRHILIGEEAEAYHVRLTSAEAQATDADIRPLDVALDDNEAFLRSLGVVSTS